MVNVVWIVGRTRESGSWQVLGVFTSEELAISACTTERDFIGPMEVDKKMPDLMLSWPDAYYPLVGK